VKHAADLQRLYMTLKKNGGDDRIVIESE